MHSYERILEAVARGWCDDKNKNKVMDSDLAVSIAKEVYRLGLTSSEEGGPKKLKCIDGYEWCAGDHTQSVYHIGAKSKPKDSEVWCEHIHLKQEIEHPKAWYFDNGKEQYFLYCAEFWKFCPICGTPRPAVKTLGEKFRELGNMFQNLQLSHHNGKGYYECMAEIAEEWFKSKQNE